MQWESGDQIPIGPYRDAIEVWTSGKVRASDWPLTDRETELVSNAGLVRPATPAPQKTGTEG